MSLHHTDSHSHPLQRRTSATKAKDVEKEVKEKEEKTEVVSQLPSRNLIQPCIDILLTLSHPLQRQSTASNAMTADKEVKEKEEETGRDVSRLLRLLPRVPNQLCIDIMLTQSRISSRPQLILRDL